MKNNLINNNYLSNNEVEENLEEEKSDENSSELLETVKISPFTFEFLNMLHNQSKENISLASETLSILIKLTDENLIEEKFEKINSLIENAEYVVKGFSDFLNVGEEPSINLGDTFLSQIWTGDMYNSNKQKALNELYKNLINDYNSIFEINEEIDKN